MSRGWKVAAVVVGLLMVNGIVMSFLRSPSEEHGRPLPPRPQTLRGGAKKVVMHDNDYEMFIRVETTKGPPVQVVKIASQLDEQDCERKRADEKLGMFECRSLRLVSRTHDSSARVQSYATEGRVHGDRYVLSLVGAEGMESTFVVHVDD
jgi:hypothetical protein